MMKCKSKEKNKQFLISFLFLLSIGLGKAQTVSTFVRSFPGDGEISFDNDANIYVNDSGENGFLNGDKVFKVSPTGEATLFCENLPAWPVGSIFDSKGNLLVSGWQAGKISKIQPNGSSTIVASGINGAGSIELDEDNNIYVVEYLTNKVLRFDSEGSNRLEYAAGFPIFNPAGLAYIKSKKELYVSNWSNNKICLIDSNQVVTVFAALPVQNVGPIKIFGRYIFATSPQYHRIYKISLDDPTDIELFAGTGTKGNKDGNIRTATFNTPTGIGTLDGKTFYIAETFGGTGRLRVVSDVNLGAKSEPLDNFNIIYPNPSSSHIKVALPAIIPKNLKALIFNSQGQYIHQLSYDILMYSLSLDIEGLPKGNYYLKLTDNDKILLIEQFVKL